MIRCLAALVLAAGFLSGGGSVSAGTMQQRLERVCAGAIDRLCAAARPDGGRINACLTSHRAELAPDCARLVDVAD